MIIEIVATMINIFVLWVICVGIGYICTWLHHGVIYGVYVYVTVSATIALTHAHQHPVLSLVPHWILLMAHVAVLMGLYTGASRRARHSSQ